MRRKKKSWCYDYSVEVRLVISVPNNYPGDWCACVCVLPLICVTSMITFISLSHPCQSAFKCISQSSKWITNQAHFMCVNYGRNRAFSLI